MTALRILVTLYLVLWLLGVSSLAAADTDLNVSLKPGDYQSLLTAPFTPTSIEAVLASTPHPLIWKKLAQQATSGVAVKVVVSYQEALRRHGTERLQKLEAAGADVRLIDLPLSESFLLLHGKSPEQTYLVAGAGLVLAFGDLWPVKTLLRSDDQSLTAAFHEEFHFLWKSGRDFGGFAKNPVVATAAADRLAKTRFGSVNLLPLKVGSRWSFHPAVKRDRGVINHALLETIRSATRKIYFVTPLAPQGEVYKALAQALSRGVQVKMVVGDSPEIACQNPENPTKGTRLTCLMQMGAQIKTLSQRGKPSHEAFVIADEDRSLLFSAAPNAHLEMKRFSYAIGLESSANLFRAFQKWTSSP